MRPEIEAAIKTIEQCHGFDDETSGVGEAFAKIKAELDRTCRWSSYEYLMVQTSCFPAPQNWYSTLPNYCPYCGGRVVPCKNQTGAEEPNPQVTGGGTPSA